MSDMKFTPGPWGYENNHLGAVIYAECEQAWDLATVPDGGMGDTLANSKLIAAAPELLEALESWAAYANSNGWTDADHHDGDPATTGWITRTRAAIAKAKGEAV